MRKTGLILAALAGVLYLGLHLFLGSAAFQKRLLQEIRGAVSKFGLNIEVESIEFATLSPKLYLNRVTLTSVPDAKISFPAPLTIDKIKVAIEPWALISKEIVISEASLYNPKIILPNADYLYRRFQRVLRGKKRVEVESGSFTVVVKKIGVVDALFNVVSKNPEFSIQSSSLTLYLENERAEQRSLFLKSNDLRFRRPKTDLQLSQTEVDLDLTQERVRVNRGRFRGKDFSIDLQGDATLPLMTKRRKWPKEVNATYDIRVPLLLLKQFPEIETPELEGEVLSSGTVELVRGRYAGKGSVTYSGFKVAGYGIGNGRLNYALIGDQVLLDGLQLQYGRGLLRSKRVDIKLASPMEIKGKLELDGVRLEGILDSVRAFNTPVRMRFDGEMDFKGQLESPLKIDAQLNSKISQFYVLDENNKGLAKDNQILYVPKGQADGLFTFLEEKVDYDVGFEILSGKVQTQGFIGYDEQAEVNVKAKDVSITELREIAGLSFGGRADIDSVVQVKGTDVDVRGKLVTRDFELSDIVFGGVTGRAQYKNNLLSFEDIELLTELEPVRSRGFVDFNPEVTHYKFDVNARRLGIDRAFEIFEKQKLEFSVPTEGEAAVQVNIEGGKESEDIKVDVRGQGKNFRWYGEHWNSSKFHIVYRPDRIDLKNVLLRKPSGALEVQSRIQGKESRLSLTSRGLRVEELNHIGKAPLAGGIGGVLVLTGDLTRPALSGQININQTTFRGRPLEDSDFKLRSEGGQTEILGKLFGERLNGRWARLLKEKQEKREDKWELLLYFKEFDLSPLLTVVMQKDIPTFTEVIASGDLKLNGDFVGWESLEGSATIGQLVLGLKETPMKNRSPVQVEIEKGAIKVSRVHLVGRDSQFSFDLHYRPDELIESSLDGKVDLQFVQPFIPGLEYGTGKVSMGLRLSGKSTNYRLLGNIVLENGTFRLDGLFDEFRNVEAQLSLSQDRINVDRFQSTLNGGKLDVSGDVRIAKFRSLIPNLKLSANKVLMRVQNALAGRFSGDFFIRGDATPYVLSGQCSVAEGSLTSFEIKPGTPTNSGPLFRYDIQCNADDKLFVNTDVMNAEFKGDFHVLGNSNQVGLKGSAEAVRGLVLFRQKEFNITSGVVRFESEESIAPRFNVSAQATVKEERTQVPQEYQVSLLSFGTPEDYSIRLSSAPALAEADIISLLLLGVTSRTQDDNYVDFGTTLVGEIPIQSKLEDELGVDIKIGSQAGQDANATTESSTATTPVPWVQIRKGIGNKTKLSTSRTLEDTPVTEVKAEHELSDNVTVNGSLVDKTRGRSETQSYGLDFRYRFQFE